MSRDALLALDLGTTGVRALVVSPVGEVRARCYRPLETRFPSPGRVEQDPLQWWEASLAVLRGALEGAGLRARDVAALGVVTQRSTAVAWDADTGAPLAPAIGWQDGRTAERAAELAAQGIPIGTLPSATKFEWWLRHEPAVQQAARSGRLRLGTPDAWLGFRLTGGAAHVTDPGQASCTGLHHLRRGQWLPGALELFGLERDWLPQLAATSGVVGETPAGLLGAAVPVAARAGDQQAASFAQGVRAPGDAKLTLGTAAMLEVHAGDTPPAPREGAYPVALWQLADGTRAFGLEGSVLTAGAAVEWLVELGLLEQPAALDRLAREADSALDVVFVPALQGLGTPFLDTAARGLLGGLTRGAGRPHVARAVIDGIAQRCTDVCSALAPDLDRLRVDGGLARSDLLLQRLADFCGRPVERASETETTSLGAAWLAGLATAGAEGPDARFLPPGDRFHPSLPEAARRAARARWRDAVAWCRSDPGG